MFFIGMVIIFFSLVHMLITNDEQKTFYIFMGSLIACFILGYGVPLNELGDLVISSNIFSVIGNIIILGITFYLIGHFEKTVFIDDYRLVLRSFFFRYETITLAFFLMGILFATGDLFTDFLVMVTALRLFKVDRFISYITLTSVLFFNSLFNYLNINFESLPLAYTGSLEGVYTNTNDFIVFLIIVIMLALFFAGYLVRSLEKEIKLEWRSLGIIVIVFVVGMLGKDVLSSQQLLVYLPIVGLILLFCNDLNVRKKFSRYRNYPITLSLILIVAFILTIVISEYSLVFFIVCSLLVNGIILGEKYQLDDSVFDFEHQVNLKTIVISGALIELVILFANHSIYNSTAVGVPFLSFEFTNMLNHIGSLLERTFSLYTLGSMFSTYSLNFIPTNIEIGQIQYLAMVMPALFVISLPAQILILNSTRYHTKMSVEIVIGVIAFGLILLTLVSYGIGV